VQEKRNAAIFRNNKVQGKGKGRLTRSLNRGKKLQKIKSGKKPRQSEKRGLKAIALQKASSKREPEVLHLQERLGGKGKGSGGEKIREMAAPIHDRGTVSQEECTNRKKTKRLCPTIWKSWLLCRMFKKEKMGYLNGSRKKKKGRVKREESSVSKRGLLKKKKHSKESLGRGKRRKSRKSNLGGRRGRRPGEEKKGRNLRHLAKARELKGSGGQQSDAYNELQEEK